VSKLTKKDYEVLEKYVDFAKAGAPEEALKKAIIAVYDYSLTDPNLSSKVWSRKKNIVKTEKLAELFALAGVDKLKVANKLSELLEAKSTIVFHGKIMKNEDGSNVEIPDNRTQLSAATLASNILGINQKNQTVDISRQINNLVVFMEDVDSARKRVASDEQAKEVIQEDYKVTGTLGEEGGLD